MGACLGTTHSMSDELETSVAVRARKVAAAQHLEEKQAYHRSVVEGLKQVYKVQRLLGEGAEGNTYLVQDVHTHQPWAAKMVKLPLPPKFVHAIFREIKLQSELGQGHVNIITPEEVLLTSHFLGLVMEYAPGGSLTDYVTRKYKLCGGRGLLIEEDEARYLFHQIVSAVDYCHKHHVSHRDLKLDNVLLTGHNPPHIKLCDFGFANGWGPDSHFTTVIGTPDYLAPQVTVGKAKGVPVRYHGVKADVWALGVLLCVVLLGKFPFEGSSSSVLAADDIMVKVWLQQRSKWCDNPNLRAQLQFISPQAFDLLDRIFEPDEERRIDVQGILAHPWMQLPMRPHFAQELQRINAQQAAAECKVVAGGYQCKQRDAAIAHLIHLAGSEEFKHRATEPITDQTTYQIWTRVGLRNAEDSNTQGQGLDAPTSAQSWRRRSYAEGMLQQEYSPGGSHHNHYGAHSGSRSATQSSLELTHSQSLPDFLPGTDSECSTARSCRYSPVPTPKAKTAASSAYQHAKGACKAPEQPCVWPARLHLHVDATA